MNKKGFTLVELLAVIVLLGLILVITMTNGFGIFNKAKSGINQIEENNLIEAAKVFLVDVDNGFVTTGFDNSKIRVVCENGSCSYITIDPNNVITKDACNNTFCGTTVNVDYLKTNNYFNDNKGKCMNANLNIRLEGNLVYTDFIVKNTGTEDICTKKNLDSEGINSIDYKLINAAKEYLKELAKNNDASISDYFTEKPMSISNSISVSWFDIDEEYTCSGEITMQVLGEFNTTDYVVEKQNDSVICKN